ncbi:MAG: hypothetical protein L0Y56_06255 [Nitrospira sp.]|nr:hypothetical protein [Nitrospira sp.]
MNVFIQVSVLREAMTGATIATLAGGSAEDMKIRLAKAIYYHLHVTGASVPVEIQLPPNFSLDMPRVSLPEWNVYVENFTVPYYIPQKVKDQIVNGTLRGSEHAVIDLTRMETEMLGLALGACPPPYLAAKLVLPDSVIVSTQNNLLRKLR